MPIVTPLTSRLGLRYPIVVAPLGHGTTPDFLAHLAQAGSMGFLGLLHIPEPSVGGVVRDCVERTAEGPGFGINLTLITDQMNRLGSALDAGCRVVSLWQGEPELYVRRAKDAGAIVFWTINNLSDAARAADLGVDFIVAQGREAGGHLVGAAPLMSFLPAVVDAAQDVPVVAAGGIADGRGIAAALSLGACGVWMGTRFVASAECHCHPGHKEKIVKAGFDDVVETTLFDGAWPDSPHRILRNSTFDRWEAAGRPPRGNRPGEGERIGTLGDGSPMLRYHFATPWDTMEGDWEAGPHYAGTSAALIRSVDTVAELLKHLDTEARQAFLKCQPSQV